MSDDDDRPAGELLRRHFDDVDAEVDAITDDEVERRLGRVKQRGASGNTGLGCGNVDGPESEEDGDREDGPRGAHS